MPGLISSAAPGKKAAPKAPARRRPAPAAVAATPLTTSQDVAPPSPPPTQLDATIDQPLRDPETVSVPPSDVHKHHVPLPSLQTKETSSAEFATTINADSGIIRATGEAGTRADITKLPAVDQVGQREPLEGDATTRQKVFTAEENDLNGSATRNWHDTLSESQQPVVERASISRPQTLQNEAESAPSAAAKQSVPLKPSSAARQPRERVVAGRDISPPDGLSEQQQTGVAEEETAESRLALYNVHNEQSTERAATAEAANSQTPARKPSTKRVRIDTSNTDTNRPAKKAKRSSTRSNVTVQSTALQEQAIPQSETEATTSEAPVVTPRAQRAAKRKNVAEQPSTTQRKPRRRPKSTAKFAESYEGLEAMQASAESATSLGPNNEETGSGAPAKKPKRKQKRSQRRKDGTVDDVDAQSQPEDQALEMHEIDPRTLSMWDLSLDSKRGKTSTLEKAMSQIDWHDIAQKRREAAEAIAAGQQNNDGPAVLQSVEGPDGAAKIRGTSDAAQEYESQDIDRSAESDDEESVENGAEEEPDESADANEQDSSKHLGNGGSTFTSAGFDDEDPPDGAIRLQVDANGEIIFNEEDRTIDRTAAVDAAMNSDKPIEEANDLTVHINRTSWMNNNRRDPTDRIPAWKWKSDPWSEEETDRFYDALSMFGTDFFIISKMFHPKTRRMIKAKFNREERLDSQRINDALMGKSTKRMDLNHYSQQTGRDVSVYQQYDGYEHAQQMIQAAMKEKEDAMTTTIQQEAAAAEERAEQERLAKKEKKERGRRGKGKKSKVPAEGTFGGGGPAEIAGE